MKPIGDPAASWRARSCVTLRVTLLLVALLVPGGTGWAADERPVIEITPGKERAFHAAIQDFADAIMPPDPERAARLREAVEAGLDFNGVLLPLARKAFLGPQQTEELASGRRYDCGDWSQGGADALVEGVLRGRGPGELEVAYQVWDTARCVRLVGAELVGTTAELERLGAALSDDIVKAFTGKRGAAATEIAFISTRSGNREVYVMDASGGNSRPATRGASIKAFPDWLPNGDGILYSTYLKDGLQDLFLSSRGRSPAGRILRDVLPGAAKYRGVFAPDGQHLALVASVDGAAELFRVRRNGRKLLRLTDNAPVIDIAPSWSPDGEQIAFVSDRSGSPQIYTMDRDGGNQRRITFQSSYSATPAWSPDGRWIAYGVRTEGQFDLYLTDPTGEVIVPLVVHRGNDQSPSWSPDGRKIVFSSDRRGRSDLYVVDVNGRREQRLTRGVKDNTAPAWGPFREGRRR
jgi:TolB protein